MGIEKFDLTTKQEVLPGLFPRPGEVCSIDEYSSRLKSGVILGFHYEPDELEKVEMEGFKYLLRLPENNHRGLLTKYGGFYNLGDAYHDFIISLAKRRNIKDFKRVFDQFYVFNSKEDARILSQLLTDSREQGELEFDIIEGAVISESNALPKE